MNSRRILTISAAFACLMSVSSCKSGHKDMDKPVSEEELQQENLINMDMFEDCQEEESIEPVEEDTSDDTTSEDEEILTYEKIDVKPQFDGKDEEAFQKWVAGNISYPEGAVATKDSGIVMVQFTVDTSGAVSGIKILRSVSPAVDSEAIRLLESSPVWKPASHKDSLLAVSYVIPIKFGQKSRIPKKK